MSYCVNCGVELEKSEKACPLCGVEVLNPRQPYDEKAVRPYPRRLDPVNARINRQFTATIVSICIAFPVVLSLAINLILDGRATWSLYVAGGLALIWVLFVPYFLFSQPTFVKLFVPDTAALLLYLLLVDLLADAGSWFLTLAMPLTLLTCGLVLVNGLLINLKVLRGFAIPAVILISIGILTMGTELIIKLYIQNSFQLNWSFFVMIPTLALAMVCLTVARRQTIRDEIKKRLHL
jgi:hypothetical protein